jgi:uncharacterized protein with FMN-binding domain
MDESVSNTPKIIGVSVGVIIMIGLAVLYFINHSDDTPQTNRIITTPTSQTASTPSTTASTAAIKDGTYKASSDYSVPHETNNIAVTVTVKDGVITNVQTQNSYGNHESAGYVNGFSSEISGVVVGKKLTDAQVYNVSGASDTSQGFDDALQSIIQQAQS